MVAGVGAYPAEWTLTGGIRVRCTGWAQGDMAGDSEAVRVRRQAAVDRPWTLLRQVHGARVVVVEGPGGATGEAADAAVSAAEGTALAVLTADCAPVALASPEGIMGVAHAGWRGLRAGVVEATVQAMRRLGATRIEAVLGPCIHSCCYTFGAGDLAEMEAKYGPAVRSTGRDGSATLDLPAGVRAALHGAGAHYAGGSLACTACHDGFWSWRGEPTERRQATVVWLA